MSRTLTALFDTRADAEAGKQRLISANVDADNINIHDKASMGEAGGSSSGYSTHQDRGVWGSTKNAFLPDEDRHTYEEGIRRGGVLLTADIDGDDMGRAVEALESAESVDIDERAGKWRSEGWDYKPAATGAAAGASHAAGAMGKETARGGDKTGNADTNRSAAGSEEHIQLAEEQLVVGKREVQHGGVRVRSYVTERPVHEQISLREERVNVERRRIDQPVAAGADAFQERSINMTATAEEAVVSKNARVVEELVINKTADTHVETINETVRKTEVDVDQLGTSDRTGTDRSGSTTGTTNRTGGVADKAGGLGQEALGNVKQAIGGLTGNGSLKRDGQAQERAGETKQGKRGD